MYLAITMMSDVHLHVHVHVYNSFSKGLHTQFDRYCKELHVRSGHFKWRTCALVTVWGYMDV